MLPKKVGLWDSASAPLLSEESSELSSSVTFNELMWLRMMTDASEKCVFYRIYPKSVCKYNVSEYAIGLTYLRCHILKVCPPLVPNLQWAMQSLKKTSSVVAENTFSLDVIKDMLLSMKLWKIKIFILLGIIEFVIVLLHEKFN